MTKPSAGRNSFTAMMAAVDTPAYVVTASAGGERAGCLVAFATQCSIEPPRFGVIVPTKCVYSSATNTFSVV